jgi:FkbM family methyltransferase
MMKNAIIQISATASRIFPPWAKGYLYKLGPFTRLIRGLLNYSSPEGITQISIASGGLSGMQMNLDLKSEKDYWLGTYEIDLQELICKKVENGWIAYDIGANIGFFSLLLAKLVGSSGQIFAFEPHPENVSRLLSNMKLNEIGSRVNVFSGGVLDTSRKIRFQIGPSNAMGKVEGSLGRTDLSGESIVINGISLDDFVFRDKNPPPNLIKMDIEGGEVLAVRGMKRILSEVRPLLFIEIHGQKAAQAVWEPLNEAGYRMNKLDDEKSSIKNWQDCDWKTYLMATP